MAEHGQKKKVLIAISNIAVGGGAEKVASTVASEFLKQGIDTTLLTFYTSPHEHSFAGDRISMHEATPASVFKKIPRAIQRIWKVKKVCQEKQIDVVVSFLEESNYYVLLSKLLLLNRTRMIVSVRNDPSQYKWLYKLLIRTLYPLAEKVVAVTQGVEKTLQEQFGIKHTTTIYNPVDYTDIENQATKPLPADRQWITERSPLFVTVGRLTRQKGQWHLIRAFAQVVQKYPDAVLCILGEGNYRTELTKIIVDNQLSNHVFLLGKQENVYPFLHQADVFVLPSLWEGLPNALLEAVASGVYSVATDASTGAREILAPEISLDEAIEYPLHTSKGTIVSPFATEGNIADAPTLEDKERHRQLADALCVAVEKRKELHLEKDTRFATQNILNQWKELL